MTTLFILDNKHAKLQTEDLALFNSVRNLLSYKTPGIEFTAAYKNGWSGTNYLMSKKGVFYSGLISTVENFFIERKVNYNIEDKRLPVIVNQPIDLTDRLSSLGFEVRDYQSRIVDACTNNRKGIVRAATGSGKTLSVALATAKFNKPTNIYVIGLDLLKQFHDLFSSLFDEKIGWVGNGICDIQRINIISIWTAARTLNSKIKKISDDDEFDEKEKFNIDQSKNIINCLKSADIHFLDECHAVTCQSMIDIFRVIDPERIYGFSGTPIREDNSELLSYGILGNQIVDISASELIEKGFLAQPIIKFIDVPNLSLPLANYQTVYKTYIVENEIRNKMIVDETLKLLDKKYIPLVLFKNIPHGNKLYEMFTEIGIKCELLSGKDSLDRRTEAKELLMNKSSEVLLASTICDIGFDFPMLSALILTGSGKSQIKALQRVGRVIRKFPGKKHCAIIDFYDNCKFLKKHSNIRYEIYIKEIGFKVIKSKKMKR